MADHKRRIILNLAQHFQFIRFTRIFVQTRETINLRKKNSLQTIIFPNLFPSRTKYPQRFIIWRKLKERNRCAFPPFRRLAFFSLSRYKSSPRNEIYCFEHEGECTTYSTLPSLERPWTLDPTIKPASVLKLLEQDANHGSRTPLGAIFVPRFVYRNSRTLSFDPSIADFYALRSHFACLLDGGERHLAINMDSRTAHTFRASARSHVSLNIMRVLFVLYN